MSIICAIVNKLAKMVENHVGVAHLLINRKRFEGWMQVEVVRLLSEAGIEEITVESINRSGTGYYDISYRDKAGNLWAVELKVLTNKNLSWDPMQSTPGPMDRVYADADNMNSDDKVDHKILMFLAYPVVNNSARWLEKLKGLNARGYSEICKRDFSLEFRKRHIFGVLYAYSNQPKH